MNNKHLNQLHIDANSEYELLRQTRRKKEAEQPTAFLVSNRAKDIDIQESNVGLGIQQQSHAMVRK